ncbi:MAG: serine/threonine protein kinase [Anaerolineales bacterium]|nr:serine/threonine protein kinase [Anaerolineales bacterium]
MRIGQYEILDELGEGGMAAVYLGRHVRTRRRVAVKVMAFDRATDPLYLEWFHREASLAMSLRHPDIVPVTDFGEYGPQPFLVMRYMPGGTLRDKLADAALSPQAFAAALMRVAHALDYLHGHGIVHRDVKPSNIMFDAVGRAYLADFGLAKGRAGAGASADDLMVGSPPYMSPEQVRGAPLDGRSDIYALGCLLHEALTGQVPYAEYAELEQLLLAHVYEPAPELWRVQPDLHPLWTMIVSRAMAKDPDERYDSAVTLARHVQWLIEKGWMLRAGSPSLN